mmetsp:Transcript_10474/g.14466  ORF Transcript_10474/g.14466 Transcript_10474/m.14466 type:complete len:93 (-) Transcript_10474:367-645(-)
MAHFLRRASADFISETYAKTRRALVAFLLNSSSKVLIFPPPHMHRRVWSVGYLAFDQYMPSGPPVGLADTLQNAQHILRRGKRVGGGGLETV